MKRLILKAVLPGLAALALTAGCSAFDATVDAASSDGPSFYERHGWTEERMLRHGWLEPRKYASPAIYCYRTIASPECYRAPQMDQEQRLISFFPGPVRQIR